MSQLRNVAWCNLWTVGASYRGQETPGRVHITDAEGITGKTLCGRKFPANKGFPSAGRYCKRCCAAAYARGEVKGFSKDLEWVPSEEYEG